MCNENLNNLFVGVFGCETDLRKVSDFLELEVREEDEGKVLKSEPFDCKIGGDKASLILLSVKADKYHFIVNFKNRNLFCNWQKNCRYWFDEELEYDKVPQYDNGMMKLISKCTGIIVFKNDDIFNDINYNYSRNIANILDYNKERRRQPAPVTKTDLKDEMISEKIFKDYLENLKPYDGPTSHEGNLSETDAIKLMDAVNFLCGSIFTTLQTKFLEEKFPDQIFQPVVVKFGNVRTPILTLICNEFEKNNSQKVNCKDIVELIKERKLCAASTADTKLNDFLDNGKDPIVVNFIYEVAANGDPCQIEADDIGSKVLEKNMKTIFSAISEFKKSNVQCQHQKLAELVKETVPDCKFLETIEELEYRGLIEKFAVPTKLGQTLVKGYKILGLPFSDNGEVLEKVYGWMKQISSGNVTFDETLAQAKDFYKGVFDDFFNGLDEFGEVFDNANAVVANESF